VTTYGGVVKFWDHNHHMSSYLTFICILFGFFVLIYVWIYEAVRKPDITGRLVWFNTFPHLPLTKKPKGQRMGKGAGKLNSWQIQMRGGVFIFEFKNLRPGRAIKFFKRAATKIPTPTLIHFNSSQRVKLNGGSRVNTLVRSYW